MKKPLNYFGFAFNNPEDGYNKEFLESKKGKKTIKRIKKNNKRLKKQLKEDGLDESELWNLDSTIVLFVLPRLKLFRKTLIGWPGNLTEKKWKKIVDKIIAGFEIYNTDEFSPEQYKKCQESFKLFGKYLPHLWN